MEWVIQKRMTFDKHNYSRASKNFDHYNYSTYLATSSEMAIRFAITNFKTKMGAKLPRYNALVISALILTPQQIG